MTTGEIVGLAVAGGFGLIATVLFVVFRHNKALMVPLAGLAVLSWSATMLIALKVAGVNPAELEKLVKDLT